MKVVKARNLDTKQTYEPGKQSNHAQSLPASNRGGKKIEKEIGTISSKLNS